MFSKHVSSLTSAYYHDELPPEQSRRVAEHLVRCLRCRAEFEEVRFGARLAAQLPLIPAPDSLWREIEVALDRTGRTVPVHSSPRVFPFLLQPRFAFAAVALVGLGVAVAALLMNHTPRPAGPSWDVARMQGAPRIGSAPIGDKGKLGVGQWIETDPNSRAQINVSDIGQVELDPNTRVRLMETKPTEHRLELERGRLSARISAPPKLFFVNTPSGVAEDLGCAYTLEVDDAGNSLLRVTAGWVALQLKDRESVVPAGTACATRRGIGPGTPYFEDAPESFRAALTKVDFESGATDESKSLDALLGGARVRDTITLWHLLARVNGHDRVRVYERMVELVPPPQGVTREGVLALDQRMLDSWKDKLETSWNDYSSPPMKFLRKVWTRSLGAFNGLEGKKS
jgi:ferric-dicitrate binding protein FerR (iron transport regulator)